MCTGRPSLGPSPAKLCVGAGLTVQASSLGLSPPDTPASLWCWNFLSDFHFSPPPSQVRQKHFLIVRCGVPFRILLFLLSASCGAVPGHQKGPLEAACPGLIIGNNSAICRRPGSRLAWPLGMSLSWTPLHFCASEF